MRRLFLGFVRRNMGKLCPDYLWSVLIGILFPLSLYIGKWRKIAPSQPTILTTEIPQKHYMSYSETVTALQIGGFVFNERWSSSRDAIPLYNDDVVRTEFDNKQPWCNQLAILITRSELVADKFCCWLNVDNGLYQTHFLIHIQRASKWLSDGWALSSR